MYWTEKEIKDRQRDIPRCPFDDNMYDVEESLYSKLSTRLRSFITHGVPEMIKYPAMEYAKNGFFYTNPLSVALTGLEDKRVRCVECLVTLDLDMAYDGGITQEHFLRCPSCPLAEKNWYGEYRTRRTEQDTKKAKEILINKI